MKNITWFTLNVEGTNMKEINLSAIYLLGAKIHLLTEYNPKERGNICNACIGLDDGIKWLFEEYPDLTICRSDGQFLLKSIKRVDKWFDGVLNTKRARIDKADNDIDVMFELLLDQAKKFETILLADLENINVYHPSQKGILDTQLLISKAEYAFTGNVLKKLNKNAILEVSESGKCLAFDNYTASGFHIIRALEVVLHKYYVKMCKPKNPDKSLENWGAYISELREICDDKCDTLNSDDKNHAKTVCALLQLIKNDDRNLIMHPEKKLSEDDALYLFDKSKTAIEAMAEKL